jgi:protein-S-isoprenylcysteine O-methyltransferase Ste14
VFSNRSGSRDNIEKRAPPDRTAFPALAASRSLPVESMPPGFLYRMIILLFLVVGLQLTAAGCLLFGIFVPSKRIWPPASLATWQGILMNFLFLASSLGILAMGIVDWRNLNEWGFLRLAAGVPFWLSGLAFSAWSISIMGLKRTAGVAADLAQIGPYRRSRNPQYLGFASALLGWVLISGSALTLTAALAGWFTLWLVPCAEEPWLRERYGGEYDRYRDQVPRWL